MLAKPGGVRLLDKLSFLLRSLGHSSKIADPATLRTGGCEFCLSRSDKHTNKYEEEPERVIVIPVHGSAKNAFYFIFTPMDIKKVRPSAGSTPGPGYPPALRVKYLSSKRLFTPALILTFEKILYVAVRSATL